MSDKKTKQNRIFKSDLLSTECGLISSSLFGTEFLPEENVDWKNVFNNLSTQTIQTLPGSLLGSLPLDSELKNKWKTDCIMHINNFYRNIFAQTELVNILTQNNIQFVILKGCAAAMYYPHPQYRIMGDVDFLVTPEQFDEAFQLLLNNGFENGHSEFPRHEVLYKHGCEFEMHKYFSLNGGEKELNQLDNLFFDGIKNAEIKEIEGNSFPVLPPVANGLVLLQHIKHHIKRSLGFRQITDWMMYVKNVLTDEVWTNQFEAEAEKANLKSLAENITRMCQIYFGLDNNIKWCQNADDGLCSQIFEHIIETGNMGTNRTKIRQTSDQNTGFINVFKNLQKNGLTHWKAAKKHRILRCFAWLWQIFHYLKVAFNDRISIKQIVISSTKALNNEKMFESLGCSDNYIGG